MTLADLGARVVKVERPGVGDETRTWGPPFTEHGSTYFESVNRGKESVVLDLTETGDLAVARELIRRADVVIENFKPGTMARLGLAYEDVVVGNPGLVYCSISGFGTAGGRDLLGYDFLVQAVGGLMSITGPPEDPTKVGVAVVDVLTGKDAVIGILAALAARARTGHGDHIEVTLLTSSLGAMVNQGQAALTTGVAPGRAGNAHPSIAPYETLRCRDGMIAVACGNNGQFARLVAVLGSSALATDPRYATNADRVANRETLVPDLEALLGAEDAGTWAARLTEAKVPAGVVGSILDALDLGQRLGLAPTVTIGAGRAPQVRHPVRWTAYETAQPTPPPALGEQSHAVREWLSAPTASGGDLESR